MEKQSGIYVITNTANGKQYVGQSYEMARRLRVHKNKLRAGVHNNSHLQSAWNKYGENSFTFAVIEYCSVNDLNEKEMFWIEHLKTFSPHGYNMTLGGEGNRGYRWSEASKKALCESAKRSAARYWQGKQLSNAHKEKLRMAALNRSDETIRKMSEAAKRNMANPDVKNRMILHQNIKAVYCVETATTYFSIGEAARQLGISAGNISKVCRGLIKKTAGYHFIFADVPRDTLP